MIHSSRRPRVVATWVVAVVLSLVAVPVFAKRLPEQLTKIGGSYKRDFEYRVKRELGGGTRSKAMLVSHNHEDHQRLTVLKKVHKVRSHEIDEAGSKDRALELYAHRVVGASEILRGDRGFTKRFGSIVPETVSPARGLLLQELGEGVTFDRLSWKLQEKARHEVQAAYDIASRILSIIPSKATKNFLFDPDSGRITSWYDFVADRESRNQPPLQR